MNLGLSTRSALVRAAETGLQRERRTRQRRRDSSAIFLVCVVIIGALLLAQFIGQVTR